MGHNLRTNDAIEVLRGILGFLPPLWGKVRKRGCHGSSSAVDPLSLSLSHEGRGDLWPTGQEKRLKL